MRTDETQWLIHDEPSVTAAVRAVETVALRVAAGTLTRSRHITLRAVGNVMLKIADLRKGYSGHHYADAIMKTLMVGPNEYEDALDEVHAAVFWLDSQLNKMGTSGNHWSQRLARGD